MVAARPTCSRCGLKWACSGRVDNDWPAFPLLVETRSASEGPHCISLSLALRVDVGKRSVLAVSNWQVQRGACPHNLAAIRFPATLITAEQGC